jgi:hypothetical protein
MYDPSHPKPRRFSTPSADNPSRIGLSPRAPVFMSWSARMKMKRPAAL